MTADLLLLAIGLAVLLAGGEALVRGAAGIAQVLGVSPLIVGLTVVSFGTSAPELAVNLLAAGRGESGLSFGNIVGSNLANIGLIVAAASLLRPLEVRSVVLAREFPMMLLATLVALVVASDRMLGGHAEAVWDRGDGLVLLLTFTVFIYYTSNELMRQRNHRQVSGATGVPAARAELTEDEAARTPEARASAEETGDAEQAPGRLALLIVAGSIGLALGAKLTVDGAVGLASGLGVPQAIVGLTVVAVGTSLPELAASLLAAFHRQADLAVGNVVGSNVFNLLLIGGACSVLRPIAVPAGGVEDLVMLLVLTVLLFVMGFVRERRIIRAEGVTLLLVYGAYMTQRVLFATG